MEHNDNDDQSTSSKKITENNIDSKSLSINKNSKKRKSLAIGIKNATSLLFQKEKNKNDININVNKDNKDETEKKKENNDSNSEDDDFNLEYILIKIDDYLLNKKYAKIVKELEIIEKDCESILLKTENIKYFIYIFEIKILSLCHLIDNKLSEYYTFQKNTFVFSGKKENLNDLEKNFLKLKKTLEKNMQKLKKYLNNNAMITENMKEHILLSYARGIYIQGKFCKYKKQITDSASLFSIGINILKRNIEKSIESETFLMYAKLLLSLSTILIQNKSYKKAMDNILTAQKYLIKVTFLKIDSNNGININYTIKSVHNINEDGIKPNELPWLKSIKGIIICLLLLGICFEKNDELDNAVVIYNQAFWFSLKFYKKVDLIFYTIIESIRNLSCKYKDEILRELKNKYYEERRRERLRILQEKNYSRAMRLTRISNRGCFNEEKYFKMEDRLNNVLEIIDKKTGAKNSKNKKMLPILKYFNFDRNNFYFSYNYLIKENEEKIEKIIKSKNNNYNNSNSVLDKQRNHNRKISLYDRLYTNSPFIKYNYFSQKNLKLTNISRQSSLKNTKYKNKNNYLTPNRFLFSANKNLHNNRKYFSPSPKLNSKENLYGYNTLSTKDNITETNVTNFTSMKNLNNNSNSVCKQNKTKSKIKIKLYNQTESNTKNIKPFITKNSFVFCKKFKKNCNSIDFFEKRETDFQKNTLCLKSIENIDEKIPNIIDLKEKEEIKDDAKCLFLRIRSKVEDRPVIEINKKETKPDKITLIQNEISKLENSLVTGLNGAKFKELKILEKKLKEAKQKQTLSGLMNENIKKTLMNERFNSQVNDCDKRNNEMIGSLSNEIINCEERAMKLKNKKKTSMSPILRFRVKK